MLVRNLSLLHFGRRLTLRYLRKGTHSSELSTAPEGRSSHGLPALGAGGDTIVEVMVVLAVLGLAIGISYATANRSLLETRGAEENSQATALVQSQIEELRFLAANLGTSPNYIFRSGLFCVNTSNNVVTGFTGATLSNYGIYPSGCVQSFYHLAISYSNTDDTFTLTAYYDDVQGQGQDTVTLLYRLHP